MCGIVWVFDLDRTWELDLPKTALDLLKWNKNRGQEWYGVSLLDTTGKIQTYKFQDIYDSNVLQGMEDISAQVVGIIGHARYPTSWWENSWDEYIQPFSVQNRDKWFAFAFNGNIVNAEQLAEWIEEWTSLKFPRPILDTRVLQEMILKEIESWEWDTKRILENINNVIDGQCNIALMAQDGSFTLAKDRWGFRPISYHHNRDTWVFMFSSESRALFKVGCNESDIRHLNTGETVQYNARSRKLMPGQQMNLDVPNDKSRCFFETVYFADSKTTLWGQPSNNHRYRLGQELAQWDIWTFSRDDTIVIDVPASSKNSAEWYAEKLDLIHIGSAITKNPHSQRTFIADEKTREEKIREKYIFNPELKPLIEWKKLVLIDDSIVRGSTLEYLIQALKDFYNPSEIHIRIPSPPIIGPCYYAINLKHPHELLAREFFQDATSPTQEEFDSLAEHLGSESIKYVTKEQMIQALRVDIKDMCLGCITGKYPTPCGQAKFEKQLQEK